MSTPISALLERKGLNIHSVPSSSSVAEAVEAMNRHRVGSILVVDQGRLTGIFTERDVLRRIVGQGLDPWTTEVAGVMTSGVITISPEASIEDAALLFTEKRCRHLPVVDDGRLVGTISIGDVTRWYADLHRTEAEHLKNYIAGVLSA
jgi:CBS domain-containing protein